MWQLSHCTGFLTANHLALLITPLQTYSAHLQFTEAQQETSKASLLAESIAIASPWCEAVLYSPDPPFLFGGGSGNKTIMWLTSTSCASVNSYTGPDEFHKSVTHSTSQVDTGTAQQQMAMKTRLKLTE